MRLKYNLGREVVTIYLPVVAAIFFILSALVYVGYIDLDVRHINLDFGKDKVVDVEGGGKADKEVSLSDFDSKESLNEEDILKLMELKKQKESGEKIDDDGTDTYLDDILIFAVLIAIIPYSVDTYIQKRRLKRYEGEFSDFLFEISEMMRGGIDPIKSVNELSKSNLGSMTKHVRRATARMTFGKSFDYSMRQMASSLGGNLVNKYTDLLIHASFTGGNVSEILMKASEDMKKFINLDKEKEGNLKMYVIIIYIAQAILLLLSAVFMHYVLPSFEGVNLGMFFSGLSGGAAIDIADTMIYTFHIVMINAFFVGLIAGKMSGGSIKFGLKHSAVLMIGSYIVAFFFILPQPVVTEAIIISPVSYPSSGFIGVPLPQQIVFDVTDLEGNPVENVTVNFGVSGPADGKLKNPRSITDDTGQVSTGATLGSEEGIYKITARVGDTISTIEIIAKTEE